MTSNIDPMPWVAGQQGAHFVDPLSVEDIRSGIQKVIEDKEYRNQLVANGRKNVLRFEPSRIADLYAEVYHEVAKI